MARPQPDPEVEIEQEVLVVRAEVLQGFSAAELPEDLSLLRQFLDSQPHLYATVQSFVLAPDTDERQQHSVHRRRRRDGVGILVFTRGVRTESAKGNLNIQGNIHAHILYEPFLAASKCIFT